VDARGSRHGLGRAPGHPGAEALERAGLVQAAVPDGDILAAAARGLDHAGRNEAGPEKGDGFHGRGG